MGHVSPRGTAYGASPLPYVFIICNVEGTRFNYWPQMGRVFTIGLIFRGGAYSRKGPRDGWMDGIKPWSVPLDPRDVVLVRRCRSLAHSISASRQGPPNPIRYFLWELTTRTRAQLTHQPSPHQLLSKGVVRIYIVDKLA
jgi:hypothetical protein